MSSKINGSSEIHEPHLEVSDPKKTEYELHLEIIKNTLVEPPSLWKKITTPIAHIAGEAFHKITTLAKNIIGFVGKILSHPQDAAADIHRSDRILEPSFEDLKSLSTQANLSHRNIVVGKKGQLKSTKDLWESQDLPNAAHFFSKLLIQLNLESDNLTKITPKTLSMLNYMNNDPWLNKVSEKFPLIKENILNLNRIVVIKILKMLLGETHNLTSFSTKSMRLLKILNQESWIKTTIENHPDLKKQVETANAAGLRSLIQHMVKESKKLTRLNWNSLHLLIVINQFAGVTLPENDHKLRDVLKKLNAHTASKIPEFLKLEIKKGAISQVNATLDYLNSQRWFLLEKANNPPLENEINGIEALKDPHQAIKLPTSTDFKHEFHSLETKQARGQIATKDELFDKLASPKGTKFRDFFLYEYRYFYTTEQLFTKIKDYMDNPQNHLDNKLALLQYCSSWLDNDFINGGEQRFLTLRSLFFFIETKMMVEVEISPSAQGKAILDEYKSALHRKLSARSPLSTHPTHNTAQIQVNILKWKEAIFTAATSEETYQSLLENVAKSMFNHHRSEALNITLAELTRQNWQKNPNEAKNMLNIIKTYEEAEKNLAFLILSEENPEKRELLVNFLFDLSEQCLKTNDYYSLLIIQICLNKPSINRLIETKRTQGELSVSNRKERLERTQIYNGLVSPIGKFKAYRERIQSVHEALIPIWSNYLGSLTFGEDGTPTMLSEEYYNMNKFYTLSEIQSEVHSFQTALKFQNPYKVNGPLDFRDLLGSTPKTIDELDEMSIQLQPQKQVLNDE